MRPVIERIANRRRYRARPRLEFFAIARIAGDEALVDAVRAHRAPFVVIAVEPDFGERSKAMIVGDLLHRQMAVIVDDRKFFDEAVIEIARDLALEQEVVVNERRRHATSAASSFGASRCMIASATRYAEPATMNTE